MGSQGCYVNGQESEPKPANNYLWTPQTNRVIGSLTAQKMGMSDTHTISYRTLAPSVRCSDGSHMSCF